MTVIDMPELVLEPGSDIAEGPFKRQSIVAQSAEIHIKAEGCRIVIEGAGNDIQAQGRRSHVQVEASETWVDVPDAMGSLVRVNGWDVTAPWAPRSPDEVLRGRESRSGGTSREPGTSASAEPE